MGIRTLPRRLPLDASYADDYVLYFNAGTWWQVHQQTQFAPRKHEFIAADTLTYLGFLETMSVVAGPTKPGPALWGCIHSPPTPTASTPPRTLE